MLASHAIVAPLLHSQALSDYVAGFRAHATLIRQLGNGLDGLLDEMYDCLIDDCANGVIRVPFHTRAWCLEVSRACR